MIPVGNVIRKYQELPYSLQKKVRPTVVALLHSYEYEENQRLAWKAINEIEDALAGCAVGNLCGDDYAKA